MSTGKGHRGHKEVKKSPVAKSILVAADARFTGIARANTYVGKIGKLDAFFRSIQVQGNCGCCARPVSTEIFASPDDRDESCSNNRCREVVLTQLRQKHVELSTASANLQSSRLRAVNHLEQYQPVSYGAGQYAGL